MKLSVILPISFFCLCGSLSKAARVVGVIDSLDEEQKITLKHDGIKDLAPEPGLIKLRVAAGDYAIAESGRRISGIVDSEEDPLQLHTIWPADEKDERSMMLINRDLMRPRIGKVKKKLLSVGDELPRFALYNQLGELITPQDWAGRLVVLNFIFTRSKVPSMSLATAKRMVELQNRLVDEGHSDSVRLISISLDPEYDTPGEGYSYLEALGADHETYWFLTGSPKILKYLIDQIGLVATPSEKTILNHSMVTLIADRQGKVFYRRPGSRWSVDDIYGRLEVLLTSWQ